VDRSPVATSVYPLACGRAWRRATAGRSFTPPKKIIDDPWRHNGVALAADKNGNFGLGDYDLRHNKTGDNELTTDVWFTQAAGC
jgi:hypothetical protein